MDFDLFQSDDDDDVLSAAYIQATQQHESSVVETNDAIPEFQCAGEDTLKSEFSADSFIKNGLIRQTKVRNTAIEELKLTAYEFQATQLHGRSVTQYIFGEACKNIQFLVMNVRGNRTLANIEQQQQCTHYQRRRQVTQLYQLLLETTQPVQWPLLRAQVTRMRQLLNSVLDEDTWKLIYFANSCKGNDCNVPAYHLLHGVLEWRLLDLCLLHKYELSDTLQTDDVNVSHIFTTQLARVFDDLLLCSVYLYTKKRTIDLLYSSPFVCTCFKELWLIMQQSIIQWAPTIMLKSNTVEEPLEFRSLFNQAMQRLKTKLEQYKLTPLDYCQFSNWLLSAIARLHSYNAFGQQDSYTTYIPESTENYDFCESCTQQFLNLNPSEEQLRVYICLLTPVLLQLWRPRATVVIQLWEYFHKRLNSSFFIAGGAPSNLAVACGSGRAYLERYRTLLTKAPDVNLSSYTLHVLLLGKMVQQLQEGLITGNTNQMKKLMGRIYSKFSLQKFLTLNETGIHHLIELFLVLCLCGDIKELMPNIRDQLLLLDFEKLTPNKQLAVAKGHMALLILHAEQRWDLSSYIGKLLQQLTGVRNELAICRIYADSLLEIFTHADDNGEHLLIDAWLPHFLNNSTPVEQERALEALHLIFDKFNQRVRNGYVATTNAPLLQALNEHVLPLLRLEFSTGYSPWVPQLAADFCMNTPDQPTFLKLFTYFSTAQTANREAQLQFILKLLAGTFGARLDATIVLKLWLKSLVLLGAQHKMLVTLTEHVVQLPEFRFMTALSPDELLAAKEPLCTFIAAIGKNYDSCNEYDKRLKLADKLNAYLLNFEQWLQVDLKIEKSELITRFYSFIAIVLYNCAALVYVKAKPNCFFHVAITRFVLPTNIQMGKTPEGKLSQLVHKIWPVLVQGIGRLNFKSDAYINKTLNDLIQKWTPNFKISTNTKLVAKPFIACIQSDNQELALYVFERLTSIFLATQRRQSDPNACLVITIFQEVVTAATNSPDATLAARNETNLLTFMKSCSLLALEHIMMVDDIVPSRGMLLTLFKTLINSNVFQQSNALRSLFIEHLRILAKKHLAYYTFFYFELLMKFVVISTTEVVELMEFLREEVKIVEAKRGAGEDPRIRNCLHKLQQAIDKQQL